MVQRHVLAEWRVRRTRIDYRFTTRATSTGFPACPHGGSQPRRAAAPTRPMSRRGESVRRRCRQPRALYGFQTHTAADGGDLLLELVALPQKDLDAGIALADRLVGEVEQPNADLRLLRADHFTRLRRSNGSDFAPTPSGLEWRRMLAMSCDLQ